MSVTWLVVLAVAALALACVLVPVWVLVSRARVVRRQRAHPARADSGPQRRWHAVREYERTGDAETTQPLPPIPGGEQR